MSKAELRGRRFVVVGTRPKTRAAKPAEVAAFARETSARLEDTQRKLADVQARLAEQRKLILALTERSMKERRRAEAAENRLRRAGVIRPAAGAPVVTVRGATSGVVMAWAFHGWHCGVKDPRGPWRFRACPEGAEARPYDYFEIEERDGALVHRAWCPGPWWDGERWFYVESDFIRAEIGGPRG